MADCGCSLAKLTLAHPDVQSLRQALAAIGADGIDMIEVVEGDSPGIAATIRTPSGELVEI
jgi:hypothetical protein